MQNFENEKLNKEEKKQKQEKKCTNSAESLRLDHETHWNTVVRDTFWDDDEELWDTMPDGSSLTVMTNQVLWSKGLALETRTTRTTQCYEDYDRLYTDYVSESRVYFEENFRLRLEELAAISTRAVELYLDIDGIQGISKCLLRFDEFAYLYLIARHDA